MKLTGELKKKVEQLTSIEEVRRAIAEAGIELTDEELESITAGFRFLPGDNKKIYNFK